MKLSLVVPCYNEAESVAAFHQTVLTVFQGCGYDYEVVYVDDGSKDTTLYNLKKIYDEGKCPVKIVSFSRNFGKEAALYAGLQQTEGDYISFIDADLQQHPETVLNMVRILDNQPKTDVVAAYQDRRNEGKVLAFFKKAFYKLINRLSDIDLKADASDFRTFRRSVAESIMILGEYHRFSKGIFAWIGYETDYIPYVAGTRVAGKTKWSFFKLLNYAVDGIIGYSTKPLRIATFLGVFTSCLSMLYLIFVVLQKLIAGIDIPGYATIIVLILFLGGMQLFCIGIIGEYIGKIFEQSKDRPIYITKEIIK